MAKNILDRKTGGKIRYYLFLLLMTTLVNSVQLQPVDRKQGEKEQTNGNNHALQRSSLRKKSLDCPIAILGAGVAGSHTAYRLAPIHRQNLCIFEQESYVGGRTYDLSYNGNVPPAYSNTSVSSQGALRFYADQPVIRALADELEIPYYRYDYQSQLIKTRGQRYTSYNTMCANSYINLTCTNDADGLNAADQLWTKLLEVYRHNKSSLYNYADFTAFCRAVLGDEATEYLRDSFRFRGDFKGTNAYAYMEFLEQDWNLAGPIFYPNQGMSQFPKRMVARATDDHRARLYLNEKVLRIDDTRPNVSGYVFSIETSRFRIRAKQIVSAMDPSGWQSIRGSIAHDIKRNRHFRAILPMKTVTIQCYWPRRWWEDSTSFGSNIDRAWTRQNCINFIEIISQHPQERNQNVTRAVFDDGLCTDTWSALIERSSSANLIQEVRRGLQSIFSDVEIPVPTKVFTNIWPGAWHFQTANSEFKNEDITRWALKPLKRFRQQQLTLVGEAFNLGRATWIDAAVKSSLFTLTSQFGFSSRCYDNDSASGGQFCSAITF